VYQHSEGEINELPDASSHQAPAGYSKLGVARSHCPIHSNICDHVTAKKIFCPSSTRA